MIELKDNQQDAVDRLGNGKILFGGVGSGKTITSLAYFYTKVCGGVLNDRGSLRRPMDIYVITTAKKREKKEWEDEAHGFSISAERDHSVAGIRITVDSWNNIGKYTDVRDAFFVFDEQRLVGRGAWVKSFYKIAEHNQWILLTATPADNWLDLAPVFIANGFYKNITQFRDLHVEYETFSKFPKVKKYHNLGVLVRNRNAIYVHMPYESHVERVFHMVDVGYDTDLMEEVQKKRWHVFEKRPLRDVGELFIVMRKVANSDASRLDAVRRLLSTHDRVIVFYNFDYELEALRTLQYELPFIGHEFAEWNGHKHQPLPTRDRWVYLVQYTAGAEGWNCITTNTMVFYSLNYSYKIFHQAQGRIDRMNTPFKVANYYILKSKSQIDDAIWRALKEKRSFNESAVRGQFVRAA